MPKPTEVNIEEQVTTEINAQSAASSTPATPAPAQPSKPATPPVIDDPEVELEGGNKVKMSDLKKGYMMQSDYTTKTQQLAEQKKEVEELANLANYLKANPAKLQRIISILDEKEQAITDKKEEIADELEGLDPNDPLAKALKAQKSMLQKALSEIESMKRGQEETQKQTLVQQAQQVLTKTLDEATKDFSFEDDEEKGFWKQMVLSHLKDNPKQYKDEADFVSTIKEIGKRYFDTISKIAEKRVAKYVKSKGGVVPTTPSVPGAPISKKPSSDNLDEIIREELEKEEALNPK
jgi:hypothetical protein